MACGETLRQASEHVPTPDAWKLSDSEACCLKPLGLWSLVLLCRKPTQDVRAERECDILRGRASQAGRQLAGREGTKAWRREGPSAPAHGDKLIS